jgi:hypothetical protein
MNTVVAAIIVAISIVAGIGIGIGIAMNKDEDEELAEFPAAPKKEKKKKSLPFEVNQDGKNVALVVYDPDNPCVVKVVEDALTILGETGGVTNILEVNDSSTSVIHLFCSNPEKVRNELNRLLMNSMKITKKA